MNKNYIIIILAIVIFFLMRRSSNKTVEYIHKTDTITVVSVDTLFIESVRVESIVIEKPYPVYKEVLANSDTIYTYSDTVLVDSVTIDFTAKIKGSLESITFGVTNKYPVITKTVDRLVTNTVYPDGFFVGGFLSTQTIGVGVSYVKNKHQISLDYGVNNTIQLGYKFRIR